MRILTIFKKNLKTVSRNWSYVIVLFICPLLLIMVAGIMINSNDFKNIKLGVIDKDPNYDFNLQMVRSVTNYESISDCIAALTNGQVSACLYVAFTNNSRDIEIYLDNTHKMLLLYMKQFILENVFREQSGMLQETNDQINSKLAIYSASIGDSKVQLQEVYGELQGQEEQLIRYRENLTKVRTDFDKVYWPLKNLEPSLNEIRSNLTRDRDNFQKNLSEFQNRKEDTINEINAIKSFLSSRLSAGDYTYVASQLDDIITNLNGLDASLAGLNSLYANPQLIVIIDSLSNIIPQMDSMRITLENLDTDLGASIDRTRNSEQRVLYFMVKLNEASNEISSFSTGIASNSSMNLNFKQAFNISEDPIFLVFPLIVTIIITFSALVLSNMFIIKQVNQPSYLRDIITPTWDINFLLADYLINLFFMAIQVGVLFVVGCYWFGISTAVLQPFAIAIFLAASVFIFVGMSIGYLIRSQSLSMLITIFLVMVLFIFSDLIVPADLTAPLVKFFVDMNPFVILNKAMVNILLLQQPLLQLHLILTKLSIFGAVGLLVAYFAKKFSKEDVTK